jgi:ABC-type branched-subunit amino acid transport system ATPase component
MKRDRATPLEVESLSVRYGGLRALDGVSLRVTPKGIVGLIGPNGAGKTTLFDCVTGAVTPAEGEVRLFGRDVTGWPMHRRARLGVGRTFQRLELFGSLSVEENLVAAVEAHLRKGGVFSDLLALPPSVETRADALDLVRPVMERLGLATYADVAAGDLPIGLARMVELARALCSYPKLMLLDEPSSGLSQEESRSLANLLREIRDERGRSMLVVEHDMSFVLGLAEYVYVLDFGRLLAEGTPEEVRANPAVRAAYLGEEPGGSPSPERAGDAGGQEPSRSGQSPAQAWWEGARVAPG